MHAPGLWWPGCVPFLVQAHPLLQGVLRGYDQETNLILDQCHERVYSTKVRPATDLVAGCTLPRLQLTYLDIQAGVEQLMLGLYMIRGDNMCDSARSLHCMFIPLDGSSVM